MRIATVQFAPAWKDKAGNLQKLSALVTEAAGQGAKLVVLPELCTTGYSFMSDADARPFAETVGGFESQDSTTSMATFYQLASNLNVHIVFGYVELDVGTNKLYNSQVIIGPDGSYDGYRKINFFGNDWLWASHGTTNPPVVDVDGVRVGLLVCRDVRDKVNDKWTDLYSPGDADVVCLSANWGKGGFPSGSWIDFVEENKTALVVSNRYGTEEHNDFGLGGVCIIDKNQKVNCEGLVWGKDCIVYGDV
jgi:N-carbamoylputrescine amidase